MDWLQAIILGIVQGVTEFLPVSSSGHLVIFQKLVGIEQHSLAFDVAAHLGTLCSVITIYFGLIRSVAKETLAFPFRREVTPRVRLAFFVAAGSVPTAVIGLSLKDTFESLFSNLVAVGCFLIVTGTVLFLTRKSTSADGPTDYRSAINIDQLTYQKALLIGVAQGMAIAPGISRSGMTIAAGLFLGLPSNVAAMFSFMLAIPAVLGAGILQLKDVTWSAGVVNSLATGFVVAYISGVVGLWMVLHFVKKGRLQVFSAYLWIVGLSAIWWGL